MASKQKKKRQIGARTLSDMLVCSAEYLETGVLPFDIVAQNGVEHGDIVELASKSGIGKTTLFLTICKKRLDLVPDLKILYLDVEKGVKKDILDGIGLTKYKEEGRFVVAYPYDYRDMEKIFDELLFSKDPNHEVPYDDIFVDSITSVVPFGTEAGSILDNQPGLKARQMSNFLEKYRGHLQITGTTLWLINQYRTKIAFGFGKETTEEPAGGNALQFYSDIRFRLEEGPTLTREEQTINGIAIVKYGNVAWLYTTKNRGGRPYIKVGVPIIFGRGVSLVLFLDQVLTDNKLITWSGSWGSIAFPGMPTILAEIKFNGRKDLYKLLKDHHTELVESLKAGGYLSLTRGEV